MDKTSSRRPALLTVDIQAICANWRRFASLVGPENTAAVVKADAYGCGADRVAPALAGAGARVFFVASSGEGVALRRALGPGAEILVLNGPAQPEADLYRQNALSPVLNSLTQILVWRQWSMPGRVALHVDTGMNRLGVPLSDVGEALALTDGRLSLIMSHLACASEPSHALNALQAGRFATVRARANGAAFSLSATAGALMGGPFAEGLIRAGIGLYGDNGFDAGGPPLACAVRFDAPVLQIRHADRGETVGYGATAVLERPTRLAAVGLGYADGYLRAAAGRGYGVIENVRCPVVGRISMDLIMLDVTGAPAAREGAWVEMLGPNAVLKDVAAAAQTSPYEVLTSLGKSKRRYASVSA